MLDEAQVAEVFRRLAKTMPGRTEGAKGPKGQPDAFRSCIACILSAQSRDANTDRATRALFARARTPSSMLALEEGTIAEAIKPAGLYNMKARNIRAFCAALIDRHAGIVPETREELMSLPGIGRKCADIVLQFTFGHDTIAVDTHVFRVCNRIGLTEATTAERAADQIEARAPEWAFHEGHFWLIQLGKRVCHPRVPECPRCPANDLCEFYAALRAGN